MIVFRKDYLKTIYKVPKPYATVKMTLSLVIRNVWTFRKTKSHFYYCSNFIYAKEKDSRNTASQNTVYHFFNCFNFAFISEPSYLLGGLVIFSIARSTAACLSSSIFLTRPAS